MPYDFTQRTPEITIKDRHCGYGKSTDLIASLSPDRSYLIVLPLNTEVERFKDHAPKDVVLVEPLSTNDEDPAKRSMASHNRKRDHLRELLIGGHASRAARHSAQSPVTPRVSCSASKPVRSRLTRRRAA